MPKDGLAIVIAKKKPGEDGGPEGPPLEDESMEMDEAMGQELMGAMESKDPVALVQIIRDIVSGA